MKKLSLLALVMVLVFVLSSCSAQNGSDTKDSGTQKTEVTESAPAKDDTKEEVKPLEILNSGYSTSNSLGEFYVHYNITIKNPNKSKAIEYPSFRITAKATDGSVLGTDDQTLNLIYPGQEMTFASQGPSSQQKPASVEFEIIPPDDYNIIDVSTLEHPEAAKLTVENPKKQGDSITGTIKNGSDYMIDDVVVVVVYKDSAGKTMGGEDTFVEKLAANGTVPFEIWAYGDNVSNSFDVYAYPW